MADLEAIRRKLTEISKVELVNEDMELRQAVDVSYRQLLTGFNVTVAKLTIFMDSNGLETDPRSACRKMTIENHYVKPDPNLIAAYLNNEISDKPEIYDDIPDMEKDMLSEVDDATED